MLTERGATKLKELGALPLTVSESQIGDFLRQYRPKCPDEACGMEIHSVVEVKRQGKYGQAYTYVRVMHKDRRKTGTKDGRRYCYFPVGRGE